MLSFILYLVATQLVVWQLPITAAQLSSERYGFSLCMYFGVLSLSLLPLFFVYVVRCPVSLGVVHTSTRVTSVVLDDNASLSQRLPHCREHSLHHRLHTPSLYCSWTFSTLTLIFLSSILILSTHTLHTPLLTPHALAICVIVRSTIVVYLLTHRKRGRFRFTNHGQMGQGLITEFTRYEKYWGHWLNSWQHQDNDVYSSGPLLNVSHWVSASPLIHA